MKELNLANFYKQFPDEKACLAYLEKMRWPQGVACPHCGSVKTYKFKDGLLFKCGEKECRKQFTAKVGTIFTDTHIALQKWFLAIYLLTSRKKGTSSVQLAKDLEITQKSAWFMLQRIRYAMKYSLDKPLDGTIEADETYIGGKTADSRGRFHNKVAVIGMVEKRKNTGRIVTEVTKHADATVAMPFIRAMAKQNSTIHTDESAIYHRLGREYPHKYVTHKKLEYVRGDVSTNTIDGAWNHLKLGLKAIYMGVSPKHLPKYCMEFDYRYNTRSLKDGERFTQWFEGINGRHLPYKSLVG